MTPSRIFTYVATAAFAAVLAAGCQNNTPIDSIPGDHPRSAVVQVAASPSESPQDAASPAPEPSPPAPVEASPADLNPPAEPSPVEETIHGVHPGAFCSQHDSYGLTTSGTLMQCKTSATDSRYRWRKA